MAPQEHNEGYTDGGLFGMNLLLALEEQGIAACPPQHYVPQGSGESNPQVAEYTIK